MAAVLAALAWDSCPHLITHKSNSSDHNTDVRKNTALATNSCSVCTSNCDGKNHCLPCRLSISHFKTCNCFSNDAFKVSNCI